MSSKKVSTLTIRLTAEEAKQLEELKTLVHRNTGSEALKYVMRQYPRLAEHCREDEVKSAGMQHELRDIQWAVSCYVNSLAQLEAASLRSENSQSGENASAGGRE